MKQLILVPQPRSLSLSEGTYPLALTGQIELHAADPTSLEFSATRLQTALSSLAGVNWQISTAPGGIVLELDPTLSLPAQGYRLEISTAGVVARASQSAGLFYAVCTLIQLLQQAGMELPALVIEDWPDYPARGVMLDISRDKVPTQETLLELVDLLASWKINQFQLYTEHTFAYRDHAEVWANASPMTAEQIQELDAYCRQRHIELVPNQNSFGHMHRWLIHPKYAELAEVTDGFMTPWGWRDGPFSLDPTNPRSLELVSGLYDELLPNFSSRLFNVDCDETFDLGQGRSQAVCDERGSGQVYLDFLLKIYEEVKRRDHTMMFWGDIILQHPDLIPQLPKDTIALDWGYEADYPFETNTAHFAQAGIPFYVCPGTSAWCSLGGRTANALANLTNAAQAGLRHGAIGFLNTDWGDLGHWQTLPVSYPGMLAGAALSWNVAAGTTLNLSTALDTFVFEDKAGEMGQFAAELGNIYELPGLAVHNGTVLFWLLQYDLPKVAEYAAKNPDLTGQTLTTAWHKLAELAARLQETDMKKANAALVQREYRLTIRMMQHACRRGLLALSDPTALPPGKLAQDIAEIMAEYEQVWLTRNRPGGLADSLSKLKQLQAEYAAL